MKKAQNPGSLLTDYLLDTDGRTYSTSTVVSPNKGTQTREILPYLYQN